MLNLIKHIIDKLRTYVSVFNCIVVLLLLFSLYFIYQTNTKNQIDDVVKNINENSATIIHSDRSISDLKSENKKLYDSIKIYKDRLESVNSVKVLYKIKTDTIYRVDSVYKSYDGDSIYYFSQNNDTISTNVKVKGRSVDWVDVDAKINDQITFINLKYGDNNITKVTTENSNVEIVDVTTWKRKMRFRDRFTIGPTVGVGYSVFNKNFDIYLGIGVTYKIN